MACNSLWGPITDRIHRLKEEPGALMRLQFLESVSAGAQVIHRHSRGLKLWDGLLLLSLLLRLLSFGGRDDKTTLPLRDDGCLWGVQTRGEQLDLGCGRSTWGGTRRGARLRDPLNDRLDPDHRGRRCFNHWCWWQLDRDLRRGLLAAPENQIGQFQNRPTGLLISVTGPGVEGQNPEVSHEETTHRSRGMRNSRRTSFFPTSLSFLSTFNINSTSLFLFSFLFSGIEPSSSINRVSASLDDPFISPMYTRRARL